ncbi:MAG: hypothetical protein JSR77_07550 [Planctomycetes bacterium]|nr:hypothetical protein [Planctomycetota bacterium]
MMKKTPYVLALLAATVATAVGQTDLPVPRGTVIQRLRVTPEGVVPAGYGDRAARTYDSISAAACATFLGSNHILDDVNFGPVGPWASTTGNVLRTITVPVGNSGTTALSFDLRVTIWDTASFSNNPMVSGSATPLFRVTVPINNITQGIFTLELTPNTSPTLPDSQVFVELEAFQRGTTTLLPLGGTNPSVLWGVELTTSGPGSSTADWGRDRNNNGVLEGGAVGAPPAEHNQSAFNGGACNAQFINLPIEITGDIAVTVPPSTTLGAIADSQTRTDVYTGGQVKWFSFTLPGDVSDAALTFLDIDTVGSSMVDTALALFDSQGNLIWSDENSGPDEQGQLTFGVGRRAANGNGLQFDGYDGELTGGQTFFLAATGGPATFDGGFSAVSTGTATGNIKLNFRSNVNGGPLPPSVPPTGHELGTLLAPGVQGTAELPGLKNVIWNVFTLCKAADGATADDFLDIDFSRSDTTGDADSATFLYDSDGNLVTFNDDDGPGLFPQLSFGSTGPRGPYSPGGQTFSGENGALPAGTYYLGSAFLNVATIAGNNRFHLRPTSGDDLAITTDFLTGILDCTPSCPPCAADFNLDGGVDGGDVESFFTAWSNGDGCGDVNLDGGVDGGDVETFFTVWQSGGC